MPRKRKHDKVSEYHLEKIARRAVLLRIDLDAARNTLVPFNEHYNALVELRSATYRCEAFLRGLPPDRFGESRSSTPGPPS